MRPLLEVENLSVAFDTDEGTVGAVDAIDLDVRRGEILGLVGESGSGKSVTALAVFRLIRPPGRIAGGSIRFDGRDLLALPEEEMRRIRGAQIAMVFQSPRTALNPVLPVGRQIARLYRLHQGCSAAEARRRTLEMLGLVGIPEPERRARDYAHQLSGGMCQRVMIAMALATSPRLLLADEPTTGLDVSIAAQILDLLRDLGRRTGASIVLITHDLGVVAGLCDRVAVMHAGQLVECADVRSLFREPAHPYTRALVRSIPRVDREVTMEPVPGVVPSLLDAPPGCRYADRCPDVLDVCRTVKPARSARARDHEVACYATEAARVAAPRG
ncbi:MAG: peptide ABC transporter ATP-binding protein [Candidatus Rokuibacteriota bacterium]|nr:MAG: peptide ABC transporter ATP-binding protein [Candidatus Rokubacteria bacterium]PYM64874.1 MAG: peptide ABC transporter ATP-binding protein [Candidatus Rokubacteria bacterium]PYN65520.1 MAG: peptide ABC transporter ATP-binding protein [Candidatus Rokubacteria bacterium]